MPLVMRAGLAVEVLPEMASRPGHQLIQQPHPPGKVYAVACGHRKIITCRHKPG